MGDTGELVLTIAGGSGALLGLTAAGISAGILFTGKPKTVVDTYNSDYGF